jgi:hypothetical protein
VSDKGPRQGLGRPADQPRSRPACSPEPTPVAYVPNPPISNSLGLKNQAVVVVEFIMQQQWEDRVLGHFGGGLEYRSTLHIGFFGEADDLVNGASTNFIQTNFGLR